MNARSYPIIKPLFKSRKARLKSMSINIICIAFTFCFGVFLTLYVHAYFSVTIFISILVPYFLARIIVKRFYPFQEIGTLECCDDKLKINKGGKVELVNIEEIKGVNIQMLIPNPKVKSHALDSKHNAYKVNIKCSLERQFSLVIFNYQDANLVANDFYDVNFLGELKHYSKSHHIRFWDWKGDPYVSL